MKPAAIVVLGMALMAVPLLQPGVRRGSSARPVAPPPAAPPGVALYPLEAGLRWSYGPLVAREIAATSHELGHDWCLMTFRLPIGTHVIPMRHTMEGVVTHREGREYLLMKFPMIPGDSWRIDLPGEKEIADCEVVGRETIRFLGKEGEAVKLKVVRTPRSGGRGITDFEWYADGVGLVKMQVTYGLKATFTLERFDRVK
jgi:hypothetical protein